MEKPKLIRLLRFGLLLTLFSNYLFIFFGPPGWHEVYLGFNNLAETLSLNPLALGYFSLFLLFLIQFWNLKKDPIPEADLVVALLLWIIKNESFFAHCHWSEVLPYLFILLFLEGKLSKKSLHFDIFLFLRVFVSLIYFSSLLQRLLDPSWQSGLFLSQFLSSPVFSKLAGSEYVSIVPGGPLLTYAVLLTEFFGVFLPFRKFTRLIIFLLVPIHIFLWAFSTESIWQMLFIVLLGVIFLEPQRAKRNFPKAKRYLQFIGVTLLIIVYTAAVPYDFRLKFLMPAVSWARSIADHLALQPLYNQRLFHAPPYKAFCPKIVIRAAKVSQDIIPLYSVTPENCLVTGQGWIQDHFYHSLLQYILTIDSWNLKHNHDPEILRDSHRIVWQNRVQGSLSAALCEGKIAKKDDDVDVLVFATVVSKKGGAIHIKSHVISFFRCLNKHVEVVPSLDDSFSKYILEHEAEIEANL